MIVGTALGRAGIERTLLRFVACTLLCCLVAVTLVAYPAFANTPAGTHITNTATLNAGPVNGRYTVSSNTAVLTADEMLDVAVVATTPTVVIAGTAAQVAVPFGVTNQGNGSEPIRITAMLGGTGATLVGVAVDANGNGVYDAGTDPLVDAGGLPVLPGQTHTVFVLVAVPAALAGDVTVAAVATAATGSGAAGTIFAGQGDGGGNAIVGHTGATATAQATLHPGVDLPTLVKSQSVLASDGSMRAFHGSVITYTLVATFPAASAAALVDDSIPAGTRYLAGSLTLDEQTLSDGADADAGSFDGGAVHVALGDVAAAIVHTIRFKTIIQ